MIVLRQRRRYCHSGQKSGEQGRPPRFRHCGRGNVVHARLVVQACDDNEFGAEV
jgi:hypothetical protein